MFEGRHIVGPPPFYANPDGISCGQCCWRMILEYFRPGGDWSFPAMDEICGAEPGKYTWVFRPLVELARRRLRVTRYSDFDVQSFIADPIEYMTGKFGLAGMENNRRNSNIPNVIADAQNFLSMQHEGLSIADRQRCWTPEDVEEDLKSGSLLFMWVNASVLNGGTGYRGHFITVYGWNDGEILAHDPGGTVDLSVASRFIKLHDLIAAASEANGGFGTMVSVGDQI